MKDEIWTNHLWKQGGHDLFLIKILRILMINSSTKLASQSWQSPPGIQSRRSDAPNPRCTPRSQPPSEQPAKPARLVALMIEMHVGNGIDLSRRKPYMIHIWRFPEIERNFLNFLNHPNFVGFSIDVPSIWGYPHGYGRPCLWGPLGSPEIHSETFTWCKQWKARLNKVKKTTNRGIQRMKTVMYTFCWYTSI